MITLNAQRRRAPRQIQYQKTQQTLFLVPLILFAILLTFALLTHLITIFDSSLGEFKFGLTEPISKSKNVDVIIELVSALSENERGSRNIVEDQIRKEVGSRNVLDHLSPTLKNSGLVRIEWSTQNLVRKTPPIALIMVTTVPEAKPQRSLIRKTWKKWAEWNNVQIVFYMGLPKEGDLRGLFLESSMYEDIIVEDFQESFYTLPVKILRMFRWFLNFYGESPSPSRPLFVIKTDHDVFLHIPNIALHLRTLAGNSSSKDAPAPLPQSYMAGTLHSNSKVTRKPTSKYFTPLDFWPNQTYPPYLGGVFYILSADLVPKILRTSFKVPLIHLEDVYITGLVAHKKLGVELRNLETSEGEGIIEKAREVEKALKFKNNIWKSIAYHGGSEDVLHFLYQTAERRLTSL